MHDNKIDFPLVPEMKTKTILLCKNYVVCSQNIFVIGAIPLCEIFDLFPNLLMLFCPAVNSQNEKLPHDKYSLGIYLRLSCVKMPNIICPYI